MAGEQAKDVERLGQSLAKRARASEQTTVHVKQGDADRKRLKQRTGAGGVTREAVTREAISLGAELGMKQRQITMDESENRWLKRKLQVWSKKIGENECHETNKL